MRRTTLCLILAALAAAPLGADEPPAPAPPSPPAPAPAAPAAAPEAAPRKGPALLAPEAQQAARERARARRSRLAPPTQAWSFEGDLVFEGFRLGRVSIQAEPVERAETTVWWVVERTVREAGQGRVVQELTCFLAPDLSLLQGESLYRSPSGESVTSFGRRDGRMEVTEHESGGGTRTVEADVPADATIGLFALARCLPKSGPEEPDPLELVLPVFDPRHAFGDDEGKPLPAGLADLLIQRQATPPHGLCAQAGAASGRAFLVLLEQGFSGVIGSLPALTVLPKAGAARLDWFDRIGEAPQSPWQAFCAFARGYHLPRRELLVSTFHWPSMLAHELKAGTFPAGTTEQQVQDYYVAEFERMSKHRTEADCDDLVVQLLVSSAVTRGADGSLTVATLPVFGGHAYTMKARDGRWFIVAVD